MVHGSTAAECGANNEVSHKIKKESSHSSLASFVLPQVMDQTITSMQALALLYGVEDLCAWRAAVLY